MFPKKCFFLNSSLFLWGNPMEYVPIYMVYSGKSHENWGTPKSSICSWDFPL
jgi:hypothetical protein